MATKHHNPVVKQPDTVAAFVLRDCVFGMAGEVATLTPADADAGAKAGLLDLNPAAIKAHKA